MDVVFDFVLSFIVDFVDFVLWIYGVCVWCLLVCGVCGFLSDAATQVMASHHNGVVRLLKHWWAKVEIDLKKPRPLQWLEDGQEQLQLAIEDGPTLEGWTWTTYPDGSEEYWVFVEDGRGFWNDDVSRHRLLEWRSLWHRLLEWRSQIIWHRLLHRVALNAMVSNLCPIRANARGLENKPAVGWTHVCMCMLSLTMFACALSLLMFCLSCFVAHCFSLVSHVVTWIWQLRFDGFFVFLNFKRSDASGRLHGKKGCCACLCMSFRFWNLVSVHVCACRLRVCACPCLKVVAPVMNVFGKGFGFPWHPQVCTLINAL